MRPITGLLYQNRFQVLKKAYDRFCERTQDAYLEYCRENREWLDDYALFMTLKDLHQGKPWYEWREELKSRDIRAMEQIRIMYAKEIDFWKMTQYLFAKQWKAVKQYAAQKGIGSSEIFPFTFPWTAPMCGLIRNCLNWMKI